MRISLFDRLARSSNPPVEMPADILRIDRHVELKLDDALLCFEFRLHNMRLWSSLPSLEYEAANTLVVQNPAYFSCCPSKHPFRDTQ